MPEPVGRGYKFNSAIAFGSKLPAGRMFKLQAVSVKTVVLAGQVPNGSRT